MKRVKEVLRLSQELGWSARQIAKSTGLGRTTVREYLERAAAASLLWRDVADKGEAEIEALLFRQRDREPTRPLPDWAQVAEELRKPSVTLQLVWLEYLQAHPDGYSYSQFRRHYLEHLKLSPDPRMRRTLTPGEICEVDYAGMTMTVVTPQGDFEASIFVGALPFSGLIYTEATRTQSSEDWLGSHVRMFSAWGGCAPKLVPDNLKTGVTRANYYDPQLNHAYVDLAKHYQIGVVPARVRKPRDKPAAENSVQQVERWVLAPLRNRTFFSLDELNAAMAEKLLELNNRPLRSDAGQSRASLFAAYEKPTLKTLPDEPFVIGAWKRFKLGRDYHVYVDGVAYSAPFTLIGKQVDVRSTASLISVFHQGERVASHARIRPEPGVLRPAVTLDEHRPPQHRAAAQLAPEVVREKAIALGGAVAVLADKIFQRADHPEQAARQVAGLLALGDKFGVAALEAAAADALSAGVHSFGYVRVWLAKGWGANGLGAKSSKASVGEPSGAGAGLHENLRGASYYH